MSGIVDVLYHIFLVLWGAWGVVVLGMTYIVKPRITEPSKSPFFVLIIACVISVLNFYTSENWIEVGIPIFVAVVAIVQIFYETKLSTIVHIPTEEDRRIEK